MSWVKRFCMACFLMSLFLGGRNAYGEEELVRSFSYDTGYSQSSYSNRAIAHFGVEFTQLNSLLFDQISLIPLVGDNPIGRSLWSLISVFATIPPSDAYTLAHHEFGHGTRLAAIGLEPEHIFVDDFSDNNEQAETSTYRNFFSYFFQSFGQSQGMTRGSGNTLFDLGSAEQPEDWNAVILMGGVNNEMAFADLLEETLYFNRGHAAYLSFYVNAKLAAADYVRSEQAGDFKNRISDMKAVSQFYKSQELEITTGEIQSGSDTALAFSATTYSLLYSVWNYLTEGDPTAFTIEVWGMRLPDVDFYLNRKGLSYKLKSGYRFSESFVVPFAFEEVYKGEPFTEASLSVRLKLDSWSFEGGLIGSNYHTSFEMVFSEFFAISAGFFHYDVNSLFGERNIPSLENGDSFDEIWGRISWVY